MQLNKEGEDALQRAVQIVDASASTPQTRIETLIQMGDWYVQIKFNVAADGSVKNARIVEHDTRDRYARDILGAVRDSRFRPKFVDGQPVATTGIVWTGKPREE